MSITTEEAERLAVKLEETFRYKDTFTGIVTYHDPCGGRFVNGEFRSNTSTALRSFAAERDALRDENARLREALRLAIEAVEFWAAYATPYFQDKHDLAEDLRKLRAALGETQ